MANDTKAAASGEGRFLALWLPTSLLAATILGFEIAGFDALYSLALLPLLPLGLTGLFLYRHRSGHVREILLFLLPYLLLEWIAELFYLSYSMRDPDGSPPVPSIADYCWLSSYLFLTIGCLRAAFGRHGLALPARAALVYGAWLVFGTGIVVWITTAVWQSQGAQVAAVLGLYPFFDVAIISLLLIIRSRHRIDAVRPFWTLLTFACLAILGGDIMWLLSKVFAANEELLVKFGDGGFIHAYLLFAAAIWVGHLLERSDVAGDRAQTETEIRRNLAAGRLNALAAVPIVVVLVTIVVLEKSAAQFVSPIAGGGLPSLLVAVIIGLLVKGGVHQWERRREAMSVYRDEFLRRLEDGVDQADADFCDGLRAALKLSPADARAIEGRVLREREDELRARLELQQRQQLARRDAEEWSAARSAWIESIRDLSAKVESDTAEKTLNKKEVKSQKSEVS